MNIDCRQLSSQKGRVHHMVKLNKHRAHFAIYCYYCTHIFGEFLKNMRVCYVHADMNPLETKPVVKRYDG